MRSIDNSRHVMYLTRSFGGYFFFFTMDGVCRAALETLNCRGAQSNREFLVPRRFRRLILDPFHRFFQSQSASGLILIAVTAAALLWANLAAETYHGFWHAEVGFRAGAFQAGNSLHFWINDGLMTLFFLLVGLEIKREVRIGELSTWRKASLPCLAAAGGMLVPAVMYLLVIGDNPGLFRGWGIATVTDIAFALGILSLMGSRVPVGLKVFLTALAIVDDLGAILLIALFYSSGIQLGFLVLAGLLCMLLWVFNRKHVIAPWPYGLVGLALWLCILFSGLHATLAGVILALFIPSRSRVNPKAFYQRSQELLEDFQEEQGEVVLSNKQHQESLQELESLCDAVQSPLQQFEHALHPWVSYGIVPVFALANAGVALADPARVLENPIVPGLLAGLFLGKPIGILLFSWLAVKVLQLCDLPSGTSWGQMWGAAQLGGIGFTMSLFITMMAFTDDSLLMGAKTGILLASIISGLAGLGILACFLRTAPRTEDAS